ncbi:hypothetical protein MtrunA17_Chr4g0062091 [Medicago truncatula]|uniref:At2g35280-like TPR domain-containing protein n=1 Tax=Medicago truncatula TaxID=3880 RepID=A0A396ILK6_MEDTR|nr:hypothetical protein MtrunA17_Chr4g0062091 [Medicago truncatula]
MYGMILLCSENHESRKQGLEHMRFLRKSKCIVSSRSKVKYLTKDMWKNNGMLMRNQIALCNSKSTCEGWRVKKGPWFLPDEDDDMTLCEDCSSVSLLLMWKLFWCVWFCVLKYLSMLVFSVSFGGSLLKGLAFEIKLPHQKNNPLVAVS